MSDTPRTDREEYPEGDGGSYYVVTVAFARELERENAKLLRYVQALEEQCDSIQLQKAQHMAK